MPQHLVASLVDDLKMKRVSQALAVEAGVLGYMSGPGGLPLDRGLGAPYILVRAPGPLPDPGAPESSGAAS